MSPLKLIPLAFFCVVLNAQATDPAICEIRSGFMGSVAQERDKGVSKEKVKKKIPKNLAAMKPWVDLVYDKMQGMSPDEVSKFTKFACARE